MRMKVFALGFVCGAVVAAGPVACIASRSGQVSLQLDRVIPATSPVGFERPGIPSAPYLFERVPPDGRFPRGTKRGGEINGMTYYLVPCVSPLDSARP